MKKFIFFVLFLIIFYISNVNTQPTLEWVRTFPDSVGFRAASYDLVLDDSDNVYITGFFQNNGSTMNSFCTIKYSSSGTQQWVANYFGNNSGGRYARAMALDKFANVYVTGYSFETGQHVDYCTIKYSSNGLQRWVRTYNSQMNDRDEADKIVGDSAGNIYVSVSTRGPTGFVITTIKYNPAGDVLWVKNYGNGVPVANVNGMVVDEKCNIYLACNYNRALTIKYDSSGSLIWSQEYGVGMAGPYSIAIDDTNNVYIAGEIEHTTGVFNFLTVKYNSVGNVSWIQEYNIDTTQSTGKNIANTIKVDSNGNLYVSGFTENISPRKLLLLKYTNSGQLIWRTIGNDTLASINNSMDLDIEGNIYIANDVDKFFDSNLYGLFKYD